MDSITLATDVAALGRQITEDATLGVEQAWTTVAVPFAEDVRAKTPVRTGYLAGRFQSAIDRIGWTWRMVIFNDADYARYVAIARWGGKNMAKTLLYDPADTMTDRMGVVIADRVATESG
jgi:hypothetical protein